MGLLVFASILGLATLLTITLSTSLTLTRIGLRRWFSLGCHRCATTRQPTLEQKKHAQRHVEGHDGDDYRSHVKELEEFKQLYYQLHNLEQFPETLSQARGVLLSLLQETSTAAEASPEHTILSVKSFSRSNLSEFQRRRDETIGKSWERYNIRRKAGSPRELFEDREEAIWWLKQIAPVKYVDGAWLGHIGKVTTPFALQRTVKSAWQILSEELGDGDLGKNHAYLFHMLLEDVAPGFPTSEVLDFGHPRHELNKLSVWKAGLSQLLISLFPNDFLPEILGYNLHFEAISMDTLKAAMELREVGIDPYYFILHVSIDNADSGHTAIALEIVCEYMECISRTQGEAAAQNTWRRLQAGYLLSSGLPGTAVCPSRKESLEVSSDSPLSPIESEVVRIFRAKAQVTYGIHCSSKIRIGSRSVAHWLDPIELASPTWQRGLLDALSSSKYWICRGNSSKSRFMKELQWKGKMFGSFSQDECHILKAWIDDMASTSTVVERQDAEWNTDDNILSGYPDFRDCLSGNFTKSWNRQTSATALFSFERLPPLDLYRLPTLEIFLPLWFSHPCLLQGFVSVPIRTATNFSCTIVKILRAQKGFLVEQEFVAGMGEVRRPDSDGLAGIGFGMMAQHGLSVDTMPSLKHVLEAWPSEFATDMLHISMRPMEYKGLLVGMATAFAQMHAAVARLSLTPMSAQDQLALQKIAERELVGLGACWKELLLDKKLHAECCKGYEIGRREIEKCFHS